MCFNRVTGQNNCVLCTPVREPPLFMAKGGGGWKILRVLYEDTNGGSHSLCRHKLFCFHLEKSKD